MSRNPRAPGRRPFLAHVTPWVVVLLSLVVGVVALRTPVVATLTGSAVWSSTPDRSHWLLKPGSGRILSMRVHGPASDTTAKVVAWLPPQYDQPQYAHHRFPVLIWLPGQPGTGPGTFRNYHFGQVASQLIRTHRVQPFVAVFPPLMVRPPRDTECTDVPGGPQALSWLGQDVPAAVQQQLRVTSPGSSWSTLGFSTGGFCAAKLLLRYPKLVAAAVSMGGYYRPIEDHTTGDLFGHDAGRAGRIDLNSPEWLLTRGSAAGLDTGTGPLLVDTSTHDQDSWVATRDFLAATQGNSRVRAFSFDGGRHHVRTYLPTLAGALGWLADHAGYGRVAARPAARHAGVPTRGGPIREHRHA